MSCKPVADSRLSCDQSRFGWIGLDLLAQVRDVNAKILSMFFRFRSPDLAEDMAMSQDAAGMFHE